jgi:hypothetical protein
LSATVPYDEQKLTEEPVDTALSPPFVSAKEDRGIAEVGTLGTRNAESVQQLFAVVEAAIRDDGERAVRRDERKALSLGLRCRPKRTVA